MRKKYFLFLLAAVLVLGAAGGTLGYYKSSAGVTNRISTKESGVTLREVFNPADHWLPGETKEKQVSFSNSGDVPQVIRFQYTGKWSDSSGASCRSLPYRRPSTLPTQAIGRKSVTGITTKKCSSPLPSPPMLLSRSHLTRA